MVTSVLMWPLAGGLSVAGGHHQVFMSVRSLISCDIHLYCCHFFFLCKCDYHYSLYVGSILGCSLSGILLVSSYFATLLFLKNNP